MNGPNVDRVAGAHLLCDAIRERGSTHAFSSSVLEHLCCPIRAVSQLNAVLAHGSLVFPYSHRTWGCHEEPWDFFRFSDSAWRALLNEVTGFEALETGQADESIVVPVTGWGNPSLHRQADLGRASATSVVLARKIGPSRAPRIVSASDLARLYPGSIPL